jgi:GNAT superfamily N-acetyltransferase
VTGMENFICKVATRDELLKRWEYLIEIHPGKNEWVTYKENAIRNFEDKSTISYLGFLNGEIICEATVYIKPSAFEGDIADSSGLLNDNMAYLAAFRTNKEYEGKGYFGKLYRFIENDLKEKGYTELCLGVGPEEVRNIEIYFHLGFTNYIKTLIEETTSKEEVILFYKKKI